MGHEIIAFLSPELKQILKYYRNWPMVEEIRLRAGKPLILRTNQGEEALGLSGRPSKIVDAYRPSQETLVKTAQIMTENSWYALEDEIRSGYLTLPGGHRVGISGRVLLDGKSIRNFKYLNGLNIRIAKEVKGAADGVRKKVLMDLSEPITIRSSLIISPPACGKTTLLRDLARQISNRGLQAVIIDERSEIAACHKGIPQLDVGDRTDVIDGCPKAEGIHVALRGLAPEVIITDEIGHPDDGAALADLMRAGVKVIASCHGRSLEEVRNRDWANRGLQAFELAVILSRRNGPGTVEKVLNLNRGA